MREGYHYRCTQWLSMLPFATLANAWLQSPGRLEDERIVVSVRSARHYLPLGVQLCPTENGSRNSLVMQRLLKSTSTYSNRSAKRQDLDVPSLLRSKIASEMSAGGVAASMIGSL